MSFDSVHVHEHVVVLGDNPSVSSGLPVALGGRASTDVMDVEEYETFERRGRGGYGGARILTKQDRANLIRGTQNFLSIRKAKRELKRIQRVSRRNLEMTHGFKRKDSSNRASHMMIQLVSARCNIRF